MVRTRGLSHIAFAVRDAEKAFAFYEQVFGCVAVYRGEGFVQAQTPGSWDVIVFEQQPDVIARPGTIAHFGFRLVDPADIEAAAIAVEKAGGKVINEGEFVPGEPYIFVRDLDGYMVEIWYELPTTVDPA